MKPKTDRYRYSIGMYLDPEEIRIMKLQTKELKRKFRYSRNDVLRVVLTKLLSDDDFIELVQVKGGLKEKKLKQQLALVNHGAG